MTGTGGVGNTFWGFQGVGRMAGWYLNGLVGSLKLVMYLVLCPFCGFCKGKEFLKGLVTLLVQVVILLNVTNGERLVLKIQD